MIVTVTVTIIVIQGGWPLEAAARRPHRLHLHILAGAGLWDAAPRGPAVAEPLVAALVAILEAVVGRRAGAAQHDGPVLEQATLREGTVPVLL